MALCHTGRDTWQKTILKAKLCAYYAVWRFSRLTCLPLKLLIIAEELSKVDSSPCSPGDTVVVYVLLLERAARKDVREVDARCFLAVSLRAVVFERGGGGCG